MEKAVVVSSVRALNEMIQDGDTGLVFEKGNVRALASALDRLISDAALRAELGKNGRRWVSENRSWEKTASILSGKLEALSAQVRDTFAS